MGTSANTLCLKQACGLVTVASNAAWTTQINVNVALFAFFFSVRCCGVHKEEACAFNVSLDKMRSGNLTLSRNLGSYLKLQLADKWFSQLLSSFSPYFHPTMSITFLRHQQLEFKIYISNCHQDKNPWVTTTLSIAVREMRQLKLEAESDREKRTLNIVLHWQP